MAKLQKYELDAVVETIVDQIKDSKKDSPEQLEYQELITTRDKVIDELKAKRQKFNDDLVEEYSKLYPKLNFGIDTYYKNINVSSISKPEHHIDTKTIERELIVSNIKGNVDETIKAIVTKYTK